jgi:hypothetical protein
MSRHRVSLLLAAFALVSCEALFPNDTNPENCVLNPTVCDSSKGSICNPTTATCQTAASCSTIAQCDSPSAVVCQSGQCVGCTADTQCVVWSTERNVSPALRYCAIPTGGAGGTCGECKSNDNCGGTVGGAFCDQTTLKCRGCLQNSECDTMQGAGDGVCKRPGDPSTLPGMTGQCVAGSAIAYLGNNPAGCEMSGANASSPSKPYCTLMAAVASGKSVIKVLPSATPYPTISLTTQSVTLIGPGRDASPGATFPGVDLNGTGTLTLSDVVVSATAGTAAVQCRGGGKLNVIASRVTGSGSANGIEADDCATLTVERSRISTPGRLALQVGGTASTSYRIVNTLVVDSGSAGNVHPVRLKSSAAGTFNYNTLTRNTGSVACLNSQVLSNSILVNNSATPPAGCMGSTSVTDDALTLGDGEEPKLSASAKARELVIDKGSAPPQGEVQTDYFGAQRPKGKGWDKGYHELE